MRVVQILKVFAFWGILFLLVLVFGFGVDISDIVAIAKSLEMNLAAYCIYLLVSIALYPIIVIVSTIRSLKAGLDFSDVVAIGLPPTLWTPYKGLDIRGLFKLKSLGLDAKGIRFDIGVHIIRFLETALWWFVVATGIYAVYHQGNNAILRAIGQKTVQEKLIVAGICIAVYCVLNLIAWLINKAVTKRWRSEPTSSYTQSGTRAQRYYERHPERIPAGCRVCGGPYPECRSSCNLFDE
jgi:hypothetical protein